MKKAFIFSAMFAAVMSSCSTTEVADNSAPAKVGFDTFIDKNVSSKAAVTTIDNIGGAKMYAYYTADAEWGSRATVDTFMNGEALTIADDGATTYTNTAYWPTGGGKISFFSYAPTATAVTVVPATKDAAFAITYATPAAAADQSDVVVSQNFDMSKTNYNASEADVSLTYDHILSKIGMSANLVADYTNTEVTITSVVLNYKGGDVQTTGTYAFDNADNGKGSWTMAAPAVYFDAAATSGELSTTATVVPYIDGTATAITEDFVMLVPQTTTASSLTASIAYSVKNVSSGFVTKYTAEVELPLQAFAAGTQYNFIVNIDLARNAIDFVTTKVNGFADPVDVTITPNITAPQN